MQRCGALRFVSFDVIGDVHGQYDKLVSLLQHLGYSEFSGVWRHQDRTAIFVGETPLPVCSPRRAA